MDVRLKKTIRIEFVAERANDSKILNAANGFMTSG
jgi:hypothetical protein